MRDQHHATPLPAMLSQLLVAFTIEFDNEFERQIPLPRIRHTGATAGAADAASEPIASPASLPKDSPHPRSGRPSSPRSNNGGRACAKSPTNWISNYTRPCPPVWRKTRSILHAFLRHPPICRCRRCSRNSYSYSGLSSNANRQPRCRSVRIRCEFSATSQFQHAKSQSAPELLRKPAALAGS
jgi:hypothetical protein